RISKELRDAIITTVFNKIFAQPVGRNIKRYTVRVDTGPGFRKQRLIDFGREELNLPDPASLLVMFREANGYRIGFFAAGATGNPHTDGLVTRFDNEFRNDLPAERAKRFFITKEPGLNGSFGRRNPLLSRDILRFRLSTGLCHLYLFYRCGHCSEQ